MHIRIQRLEKLATRLTEVTGDRHYIMGCSGAWRLHRESDGACLNKGNGDTLYPLMVGYLRAELKARGLPYYL